MKEQFAKAFAEWDRRYRADPKAFQTDFERVLKGETPETYGDACAIYFEKLLKDVDR